MKLWSEVAERAHSLFFRSREERELADELAFHLEMEREKNRTREVGIRAALGAHPREVVALMVRRALGPVAVGLALGIAFALALGRVLASVLFGVGGADPVTFAGGVGILAAATLLASVIPALRAARVDPVVALRAE